MNEGHGIARALAILDDPAHEIHRIDRLGFAFRGVAHEGQERIEQALHLVDIVFERCALVLVEQRQAQPEAGQRGAQVMAHP